MYINKLLSRIYWLCNDDITESYSSVSLFNAIVHVSIRLKKEKNELLKMVRNNLFVRNLLKLEK